MQPDNKTFVWEHLAQNVQLHFQHLSKSSYPQFLSFKQDAFSVDTIVAMEALVRYSYNSRIKDITDLNVEVDIPDSNITMNYYIDGKVGKFSSSWWSYVIYLIILQGSKKNNNMRISQLRKVDVPTCLFYPFILLPSLQYSNCQLLVP